MKRGRIRLALGITGILSLAACGSQSGQPDQPEGEVREGPTGASISTDPLSGDYVALGDSFAAMGSRHASLRGDPFCLRSAGNYPQLLDGEVVDVTCQGAVIDDLLQPRYTGTNDLSPQLDALDGNTTLVTLSIGGNDLGFGDIAGCVRQRMESEGMPDCVDVLADDIHERLETVPDDLDEVYQQIQQRTGAAHVVATGYLPLLGEGECMELGGVSDADKQWAITLTGEINDIARRAAEGNGAIFVLPDDAGDHTSCADPEERWVDIRGVETNAYPLHLTSAGHEAMADAVSAALR